MLCSCIINSIFHSNGDYYALPPHSWSCDLEYSFSLHGKVSDYVSVKKTLVINQWYLVCSFMSVGTFINWCIYHVNTNVLNSGLEYTPMTKHMSKMTIWEWLDKRRLNKLIRPTRVLSAFFSWVALESEELQGISNTKLKS